LVLAALGLLALGAGATFALFVPLAASELAMLAPRGCQLLVACFLAPYAVCALGLMSTAGASRYAAWRTTLWEIAIALAVTSYGFVELSRRQRLVPPAFVLPYWQRLVPPAREGHPGLVVVAPIAQIVMAWAFLRARHPGAFGRPAVARGAPRRTGRRARPSQSRRPRRTSTARAWASRPSARASVVMASACARSASGE
jgi:hypothetical protein